MNFRQFAFRNVKRNARAYSAYFLSSTFAVTIFFVYAMFIFHPDMTSGVGKTTALAMEAAEYIIFFLAFLFVLYSISSFLKARKKEFGILTMHGAKASQINKLIIWENMIIGTASLLAGIGSGSLLAKGFFLLSAKMLEMKRLPLYLPWKAIGLTSVAFLGLFIVISFLSLLMVRKKRVLELLLGTNQPKSEPTTSIFLSLLSVFCLAGVIYFMKQEMDRLKLIIILLLGVIGTYFLFSQLSVLVIRLLKKNRLFFWRKTNLIWLSEMAYKMKDNARMFFMVTILTTFACTFAGVVLAYEQQNAESFTNNPFAFKYYANGGPEDKWKAEVAKIDKELNQVGLKFEKIMISNVSVGFKDSYHTVLKESDYNQLMRVDKSEKIRSLKNDEAVIVTSPEKDMEVMSKKLKQLKQLSLKEGNLQLSVVEQKESRLVFPTGVLVVSDATYQTLKKVALKANPEDHEGLEVNYFVPDWPRERLPNASSAEVKMGLKFKEEMESKRESGEWTGALLARAPEYFLSKQATQMYMFIGIFIAAVFAVSIASFLHFKFYTDLNQDQRIYHGLSKIGLSPKEMIRASTIQIASLFFIPIVVAGLQSVVGLSTLNHILQFTTLYTPVLTAIGFFFALQFIFFLIVRMLYLRQLKRVMV
ncbi:ABC transporter permease [Baia soyae]|uniref:Putative ABC transport system permease protein n=1 Tax=Baia soyae TaxID=1544746 RepID=A0A4R2S079_9BACL|nr:ABC transporter permease [Baia soyae]TCP69377.1 putative ABC transport system permease protein [Baia soyae]